MKKRANFISIVMIFITLFTIVPSVCSATLVAGQGTISGWSAAQDAFHFVDQSGLTAWWSVAAYEEGGFQGWFYGFGDTDVTRLRGVKDQNDLFQATDFDYETWHTGDAAQAGDYILFSNSIYYAALFISDIYVQAGATMLDGYWAMNASGEFVHGDVVPIPGTMVLMSCGLLGLVGFYRKKIRRQ